MAGPGGAGDACLDKLAAALAGGCSDVGRGVLDRFVGVFLIHLEPHSGAAGWRCIFEYSMRIFVFESRNTSAF